MTTNNKILDTVLAVLIALLAWKIFKAISKGIEFLTPGSAASSEKDTAVNAASDKQIRNALLFFNPSYGFKMVANKYGNLNKYYVDKINFPSSEADRINEAIVKAHGNILKLLTLPVKPGGIKEAGINDDEQAVYNAFLRIPSLAALSLVAHRFGSVHTGKGGLLNFLSTFLSGEEMATIYNILKKKPTF